MKVLELRKWLRISEAAQYLSLNFREEVRDSDLLQFVLNGQLVLSVYLFEPVFALQVKIDNAESSKTENEELEFLDNGKTLRGLLDLLPVHGGVDAIESIYRQHVGGSPTRLRSSLGLFVQSEDQLVYQIQESLERKELTDWEEPQGSIDQEPLAGDAKRLEVSRSEVMFSRGTPNESVSVELEPRVNLDSTTPKWLRSLRSAFRPAVELPRGCLACVSMDNLRKFVAENSLLDDRGKNNTLGDLERSSLLKLLLGMAISKYGYQPGASRNVATGGNRGSISTDLERLGLALDSETIRKFLNEACSRFEIKSTLINDDYR